VPEYLSPDWLAAASELVASSATLAERSRGVHLVLSQTVQDDAGDISWALRLDDGTASLTVGRADDATVTFTCARATADAIHSGERSAQAAFIAGDLRIGGDVSALMQHAPLFADLDEVLSTLR
jgi:alkyl sulfatase BDS1-like metallo-beta-lactamase superfamily hydrolase